MTGKRLAILILAMFLSHSAAVFALSVTASVDTYEVEVGDPVNLSVTITGSGTSLPDPVLPDLSAFDVYSSGRNSSFSMINGAFSSTTELNYTLIPKRIGELVIGPITVRDKKQSASSNPINISVKKPGAATKGTQPADRTPSTKPRQKNQDFFIELTVDKTSPYVGEQVTLYFRFYQGVNLWDQPTLEWPKFNGVTVEDLPPISRSRKYVNGKLYQVTEIKRALFPLSSGETIIDSPRLTIKSDDFGGAMDPFGMFDRDFFRRGKPIVLTADQIKLTVKSLPNGGKPSGFTGAVGKYRIQAAADKDSVGVDEPITLKITLSGTGDLKSLPSIVLPEFPDFRVYESGKTESINQQGGVISGSRTFEMALIPKTSGIFTIPALEYSFFNPSQARYETVRTNPTRIVASGEGLADVGGAPKNVIEAGKQSFGYIITDYPRQKASTDLSRSFWFWLLQSLPICGIVAAIAFRTHYRKLLGDKSYARRISAGKRSKTIFKAAISKKAEGDYIGFCGGLYDAIIGFVSDRLDLAKSGLTLDDLRQIDSIDVNLRNELVEFLETCQDARFAPVAVDMNAVDEMLKRGSEIISRLEKAL